MPLSLRGKSVVVLSPHLDDGVFSLGAGISRHARRGGRVRVLTVFGGDPDTGAPASEWDQLPGWSSERQAVLARRKEDVTATHLVGAEACWLTYADEQYHRPRDGDAIHAAIDAATAGFDLVFVPGAPLSHADHRYLADLVLSRGLPGRQLWLYAEQPYRYWRREEFPEPVVPPDLPNGPPAGVRWSTLEAGPVDFFRKWQGTKSYASQLALLGLHRRRGLRLARVVAERLRHGGEQVLPLG